MCRDYLPSDLEPLLAEQGIERTIVVQAAATVEETYFLFDLAARHPSIAGVVGWVDLDSEVAPETLRELQSSGKLLGIRPMLQDLDDEAWILRPRVLQSLHELAQSGLAFDFLVQPRHLRHVAEVLERVPELSAVLDHCAKPDLRGGSLEVWREGLSTLAQQPGLYCKLSGLVTEADPQSWRPSDLAPAIEHALSCFGEERLVFGSDWPVCTLAASYTRVVEALRQVLGGRLSPTFEAKLFGENAQRLYRLGDWAASRS